MKDPATQERTADPQAAKHKQAATCRDNLRDRESRLKVAVHLCAWFARFLDTLPEGMAEAKDNLEEWCQLSEAVVSDFNTMRTGTAYLREQRRAEFQEFFAAEINIAATPMLRLVQGIATR